MNYRNRQQSHLNDHVFPMSAVWTPAAHDVDVMTGLELEIGTRNDVSTCGERCVCPRPGATLEPTEKDANVNA